MLDRKHISGAVTSKNEWSPSIHFLLGTFENKFVFVFLLAFIIKQIFEKNVNMFGDNYTFFIGIKPIGMIKLREMK